MAREISTLVKSLMDIEKLCECIAAFWQFQSDKFSSFGSSVAGVQIFVECGAGSEACESEIKWLEETQETFGRYHSLMSQVNAAYNFSTSLTPSKFPCVTLPSIDVKLE